MGSAGGCARVLGGATCRPGMGPGRQCMGYSAAGSATGPGRGSSPGCRLRRTLKGWFAGRWAWICPRWPLHRPPGGLGACLLAAAGKRRRSRRSVPRGPHTVLAGLRLRGLQLSFGLHPAGLRLGFQVAGLGQERGAPAEGLSPAGRCARRPGAIRRPIERAEEPLEAQPKSCLVVPVAVMAVIAVNAWLLERGLAGPLGTSLRGPEVDRGQPLDCCPRRRCRP